MRTSWVIGVAVVVLAGCDGNGPARHGSSAARPLTGKTVRAVFQREGFRIGYDARLLTMSESQLARTAELVYGPPGSGLTAKQELAGLRASRAGGMSELLAVTLGSRPTTNLAADVGIWRSASQAKAVITQTLRVTKANHAQEAALPWTRVRNVIVFASPKQSPATKSGLRDVERRLVHAP